MVEAICSSGPQKVTLKDMFTGRTFVVGSKGPDGDATTSAAAQPQALRDACPACAVCSNYRVKIGAVGIKNLEDLANRNSSVTVRTLIY